MKDPSQGENELEEQVRELLFGGEGSRAELNDLLRREESARPMAAQVLFEDAALISELRLDTARHWAELLEPPIAFPAWQSKTSRGAPERRGRWIGIAAGLAAACAIYAVWNHHEKGAEENLPEITATPNDELPVGLMRRVEGDGLSNQVVPVTADGEVELGAGRARIDLDNGVVISVTGPARMRVGLQRTRLWQGQVVVDVPEDLDIYVIETDDGRIVDLGTVFSVSAQPEHRTEMAVLSGQVRAELTTVEGGVLGKLLVEEAEGAVLDGEGAAIRRTSAGELRHDAPIPPGDPSLNVPAAYRAAIDAAEPLLVWDFEKTSSNDPVIPNRVGPNLAGLIRGKFQIEKGKRGGKFLRLGGNNRSGWIDARGLWRKQDSEPFTVELWARPDRVQWGHLFHLRVETEKDPVSGLVPRGTVAYFCMELTRSQVFGQPPSHPAVRTVFRSPPTGHADLLPPGNVNSTLASPERYIPGRWYHLVARVGPQDFTLFVDGSVAARQTISRPDHGEQELMMRLGRLSDDESDSRQFVGAIDEVAVYDRALSDEEVRTHYRTMVGGAE